MEDVQRLREEVAALRTRLRLAVGIGALLAVVLALFSLRSPPPGTITAREVVLIDDQGVTRGRWHVTGLGAAELSLADAGGSPLMALSASEDNVTVTFTDPQGRQRARLSAVEGATSLHLTAGAQAATVRVAADEAGLTLADLDRAQLAGISAGAQGTGLSLSNAPETGPQRTVVITAGPLDVAQGPALVLATNGEAGSPEIGLFEDSGKVWEAP